MEQQLQKELAYIYHYLKTYFDEMLIVDLKKMRREHKQLDFTLPYIHLVNAGIDFLGGLEKGFYEVNIKGKKIRNSGPRSRYFIEKWMGRVNELYKHEGMSELIYESIRCGLAHQAIFKEGVESYKGDNLREKHLFVRIDPDKEERIFIHALQYTDDFLKVQKIFRREFIIEKNIHIVYKRLCKLKKDKIKQLPNLIKNLKNKGYKFEEYPPATPSYGPGENNYV